MRILLAVCALVSLIATAGLVFAAFNTQQGGAVGSLVLLSIAGGTFSSALLCGYGARALSYLAEQSNLLRQIRDEQRAARVGTTHVG